MFFQQLEDAALVLQGRILDDLVHEVTIVVPVVLAVAPLVFAVIVIQTGFRIKRKPGFDDRGGIGVMDDVFLVVFLVFDDVVHQTAPEGDIRTTADRAIEIRPRGRSREPRVDADDLCVAFIPGLLQPGKRYRMVFRRVAAADQRNIGVFEIRPVIGHCSPTKRGAQTGDRGAVSDTGLMFDVRRPQAAHEFRYEVKVLIVEYGGPEAGNRLGPIDGDPAFLSDK